LGAGGEGWGTGAYAEEREFKSECEVLRIHVYHPGWESEEKMTDDEQYAYLGKLVMTKKAVDNASHRLAELSDSLSMEQLWGNTRYMDETQKNVHDALNSLRIDVEWMLEVCENAKV